MKKAKSDYSMRIIQLMLLLGILLILPALSQATIHNLWTTIYPMPNSSPNGYYSKYAYLQFSSEPSIRLHWEPGSLVESYADSTDLLVFDINFGLLSLGYHPHRLVYKILQGNIWTVNDTSLLDFSQPLPLSNSSLFTLDSLAILGASADKSAWTGTLYNEVFFIFKDSNKHFTFCHSISQDSSVWYDDYAIYVQAIVRTYLACQVQDDGTTKFDSIPQYPHETSALIPIPTVRATASPLPSRFYGVDGSRINMQRRVFPYQREHKP